MTTHAQLLTESLGAALAPEFRLLRPLGAGAMALVYLASEAALERLVAVKLLRPEFLDDETATRRFLREARAAARLAHPNVVTIHRVGTLADGLPYIVMEYVDGRTLADVLAAESPLEAERACRMLAQIAHALAAAHAKGVVHRDVRPGNVLVENATDRVALADFGIAAIKETGSEVVTRLTRAGEVLLCDPRYASPEQLLGEPITEASDVYSLGVLAYEVLTGAGPYAVATERELVAAHLQEAARSLAGFLPELPLELRHLLENCLAKKPEQRPRAERLARVLARAPGELAGGAQPAAATVRAEDEPPFFPALASFFRELRRRRVYRAAAAYLAAAFIVLQGADVVFPALPIPGWAFPALVTGTLVGFPVTLVLTWIFDLNRGGIQVTAEADPPLSPGERIARRVLQVSGLLVTVFAAALIAWWILR